MESAIGIFSLLLQQDAMIGIFSLQAGAELCQAQVKLEVADEDEVIVLI